MTRIPLLVLCLWQTAWALTITTTIPSTTTSAPGSTNAPVINTTAATPVETTKPTHTELLRQDLGPLHLSHRQRGRVILATTHMEGSDDWGVSAEQAEISCDRIARLQNNPGPVGEGFIYPGRRLWNRERPKMEGHLLSVGSVHEVITLSRLLHPLPEGSFWTGGQLTRYRVNSMKPPSPTDHIILTWTDGRIGNPKVLGMTREDEKHLQEGYTYCLALNLRESAWQARDCSDQLPYACLITPRRVSFSNKAQGSTESSTTTPTDETTTSSDDTATTTPSDGATTTTTQEGTTDGTVLREGNLSTTQAAETVSTPLQTVAAAFQHLPGMLNHLFTRNHIPTKTTAATPLSTVTPKSADESDQSTTELPTSTVTPADELETTTAAGDIEQANSELLQATEQTLTTQSTPVHSTVSDNEGEETNDNK